MDLAQFASAEPAQSKVDTPEVCNEQIVRALELDERDRATLLIDDALTRWPQNARLQLTKGEVLQSCVGPDAAARHYIGLLDGRPAHPWALQRLRTILSQSSFSLDEAEAIGTALGEAKLDDPARASVFDALLKGLDSADQFAFLRALAPGSNLLRLEVKLAIAETERGNVETALDLLLRAHAEGRSNETSTPLLSELLATCSREQEAIDLQKREILRNPERPDPYRRLLSLLQRVGDFKLAGELIQSAIERWPNDWMLLFRLNRLPVPPGRLTAIFNVISPTADQAAQRDERYRLQFALACLHVGEVQRAKDLLAEPFSDVVAPMADPVAKALAAKSNEFWLSGSRLKDDRTLDVQITRSAGARMTVIVPTGIAFGFLPPAMIDSLFAAHGLNVIYLRDFRKRAYTLGVASLGRDEGETIKTLARLTSDLGAPRTITMGGSMGGFAALRYGALLDAFAAVSFAGPTELVSMYRDTKPSIWNPSYFVKLYLERRPETPTDVVPLVQQSGATFFFQFYGADMPEDARQARRLEGIKNAAVIPIRGVSDHIVIDHMIADGSFDLLLRRLMN